MNILIIENSFKDLINSRISLGDYFRSEGNNTFYACPEPLEEGVHRLPMSRNKLDPWELAEGWFALSKLEKKLSIQTVLSYRFIPNVLNYLASFHNYRIKRVAVITGLGYAFNQTNTSTKSRLQRLLIRNFYKIASKRIQIVTQNPDDLSEIGIVNGKVILGSGITDSNLIPEAGIYTSSLKLLYVGRLLKSKGIFTAIKIFEQIKLQNISTNLIIAGSIDEENPDSITLSELKGITSISGVKYLGFVDNLDELYSTCNVLLFPSIYREGIPRVIIESLKFGLTIITTDMPGCKETVQDNGFLIKDDVKTSQVLDYLVNLNDNTLRANYKKSRQLFSDRFSSEIIYPQYLKVLNGDN